MAATRAALAGRPRAAQALVVGADGGVPGGGATVAMYSVWRTVGRPPAIVRWPRQGPLSRLSGATPTRAAIWRRSRRPSSGSSAISVRAMIGRCRAPRSAGLGRAPGRRAADLAVDLVVELGERRLEGRERALDAVHAWRYALARRFLSMPIISTIWRRRATSSARIRACSSAAVAARGAPLGEEGEQLGIQPIGLGQSPGCAREVADLARVDHRERQAAAATAAATVISKPPVASSTTSSAGRYQRATSSSSPAVASDRELSPDGRDERRDDPWRRRCPRT